MTQSVAQPRNASPRRRLLAIAAAVLLYNALTFVEWHPAAPVRGATALVAAVLMLWVGEVAAPGIVALLIPLVATLSGLLTWRAALAPWGDPIIFLFMGSFLIARALEKHGVLDIVAGWLWPAGNQRPAALNIFVVLIVSGAISTFQNNTAVAALLLGVVLKLALREARPALPLLALSYGATLGGMATPVGTAPNVIGFGKMKELEPATNFISWMQVGVPVWVGTTLLAWGVLFLTQRVTRAAPLGEGSIAERGWGRHLEQAASLPARYWAIAAFVCTAAIWLTTGLISSQLGPDSPIARITGRFLPESLVPVLFGWVLFLLPAGKGETVLTGQDFRRLDWDTLFLIAGGLCLGKVLESSGAVSELAETVNDLSLPPALLLFVIAAVTVLLSEIASNTATATLLVPIAAGIAGSAGVSPAQATWLVALSASLGFALPISTPPNAIVYGTRAIPLSVMFGAGVALDVLALIWVVLCVRWFG